MEIERKFLLKTLPDNLEDYPCRHIEQGYLSTDPVIRIRRQDEDYYLTYKSHGLMVREEYNLPLTKDAHEHLLPKIDGILIVKKRYLIPLAPAYPDLTAELDIFDGELSSLILAEVEFPSEEDANKFIPPEWFDEDVTYSMDYHNSVLSQRT